jgi:formiminotetrahydrofolate cyclodeaminase
MDMNFIEQSCESFAALLASREPVPGGGGAAALVGALGAALGNMAGNLTTGKPKYAHVAEDIADLNEKAGALRKELLALVAGDAEAFEPLVRAYGLPKGTEEEKAARLRVIEEALRNACGAPLRIMEKCGEAILLHREFASRAAPAAISDIGAGVVFSRAALLGASLNVFINTKSMTDRACAEAMNRKAKELLDTYTALADEIYAGILARIAPVN